MTQTIIPLLALLSMTSCGGDDIKSRPGNRVAVATEMIKPETTPTSAQETALIKKYVNKINPEIRDRFETLHSEWYETAMSTPEIAMSSSMEPRTKLPQYVEMVNMGEEILPLVIEKMTDDKYFFTQLIYEGIRPDDKTADKNGKSGRETAKEYVDMWLKEMAAQNGPK